MVVLNPNTYIQIIPIKANTASPYNMVLNGSFEAGTYQPTNWNYSENLSFGANGDTVSGEKYREGTKSFRILGEPENVKTLCQEIPVLGNENDIYIIGAWGKADAVPTNTIKKFKISINVYFSDGTYFVITSLIIRNNMIKIIDGRIVLFHPPVNGAEMFLISIFEFIIN